MEIAKRYSIAYKGLKNGHHEFDFKVDDAFFEAMERHTHKNVNDYLYYEMQEKFYRRIKK